MHYTIMHGTSSTNCNWLLELDKIGNKFVVSLTDKKSWRTIRRIESDHLEEASNAFTALASEFNINLVWEVEHDPSEMYANCD